MTDEMDWRAEGIENARAAGGIELERYRRPGFIGGIGIRRSQEGGPGCGFQADEDTEWIYEPESREAK